MKVMISPSKAPISRNKRGRFSRWASEVTLLRKSFHTGSASREGCLAQRA